MEHDSRPQTNRLNLKRKLTLAHVAVTLTAILLAELVAIGILAILGTDGWATRVTVVAIVAALVGLLVGAWASNRIIQRLERALRISRAWLRGQFARLNDPRNPDFAIGLKINLPPEYLLIHRVWLGAIGVLCQLGAEVPMRAELETWVPGFAEPHPEPEPEPA